MWQRPSQVVLAPVTKGLLASVGLLVLYLAIVILISGWSFAQDQFSKFWYFIVALVIGFGVQFGLYSYLRSAVNKKISGKVVAISGATSTAAMVSCCSHYLINVLPVLGVTGITTFISQYQIQFFWIGLVFNLVGTAYIANKVYWFSKSV